MMTVHTIHATTRARTDSMMDAWASYSSTPYSSSPSSSSMSGSFHSKMGHMGSSGSSYLQKRKRDCWEAYDYQVHRHQKMRYSLLQEQPHCYQARYHHDTSYYQQVDSSSYYGNELPPTKYGGNYPRRVSLEPVKEHDEYHHRSESLPSLARSFEDQQSRNNENVSQNRRRMVSKKPSFDRNRDRSSAANKAGEKRKNRMTKKHYNKKKKQEMMDATSQRIKSILVNSRLDLSYDSVQRVKYLHHKTKTLEHALRSKCNTIVQKEQDIKSWLGITTRSKTKIMELRRRLHERWAEVKDLQSEVKPKRQRLKNLKFAVLREEHTIIEEDETARV